MMKTLIRLICVYTLFAASTSAQASSLEGSYTARYGFFNRHAIDFRLGKVAAENGQGEIHLSLSEYPEFGNCKGNYNMRRTSFNGLNIQTSEGLKCQGLLGRQYSWISVSIEVSEVTELSSGSTVVGHISIRQLGPDQVELKKVLIQKR